MKTLRTLAIAAATSALATSALAADLGGDCCADLEERVAELEATTARKGNRKVSLTVSGQVHEMLLFWDDGTESNAYVVTSINSSTRFRFTGKATITPDWTAGFYLELEAFTAASSAVDQNSDDDPGNSVNVRQSNWWIESKTLGRITLGQGSPATDDIILADTEGAAPGVLSDTPLIGGGFFLRDSAGNLLLGTSLSEFAPALDTSRRNIVRYDSPTFGGFKVVAAYGEDDFWDVALWWSGKIADQITYAGGIGYLEASCLPTGSSCEFISGAADYEEFKGSASFLHNPTGLFVTGMYVHRTFDEIARTDFDYWYVRSGIVAKGLVPIGKTVFYGEYGNGQDALAGSQEAGFTGAGNIVTSSDLEVWGLGIAQHIDAAAMQLYIGYRNFDAEASGVIGGVATTNEFENLHVGFAGARIAF